jgi:hypothetical protein
MRESEVQAMKMGLTGEGAPGRVRHVAGAGTFTVPQSPRVHTLPQRACHMPCDMLYGFSLPTFPARVHPIEVQYHKTLVRSAYLREETEEVILWRNSERCLGKLAALLTKALRWEATQRTDEDQGATASQLLAPILHMLNLDYEVTESGEVLVVLSRDLRPTVPSWARVNSGWTSAMPAWSPWTGLAPPPDVPQIIPRQ